MCQFSWWQVSLEKVIKKMYIIKQMFPWLFLRDEGRPGWGATKSFPEFCDVRWQSWWKVAVCTLQPLNGVWTDIRILCYLATISFQAFYIINWFAKLFLLWCLKNFASKKIAKLRHEKRKRVRKFNKLNNLLEKLLFSVYGYDWLLERSFR